MMLRFRFQVVKHLGWRGGGEGAFRGAFAGAGFDLPGAESSVKMQPWSINYLIRAVGVKWDCSGGFACVMA